VRAIVLRSSLSHFHVGANPHEMRSWQGLPRTEIAHKMKKMYAPFLRLFAVCPIVSVLNGRVYGGGMPIALWSDYRVGVADLDVHYGNITRGMSPAAQLSEMLTSHLSLGKVLELYLENAHWDARRCLAEGLVSSVHATAATALDAAIALAEFVAAQQPAGVSRTRALVKPAVSDDLVNLESWRIACSVAEGATFTNLAGQNASLIKPAGCSGAELLALGGVPAAAPPLATSSVPSEVGEPIVGIEAMQLATPSAYVRADDLEEGGIPAKSRYNQEAVSVWDVDEDPISLAMSATRKLLSTLSPETIAAVGRLEVGTESNVDQAKSIKTYLLDLFPKENPELLGVDNTNACYGGTAALLNSLDWLRAHPEAAYAVVVVCDVAPMDDGEMGFQGAGAVAMLLGRDPALQILRDSVTCMKNTNDFFKPRYSKQLSPCMRPRESMDNYLASLDYCATKMRERHGADLATADAVAVHGGLCRSVVTRVMRHWLTTHGPSSVSYAQLMPKFESSTVHGTQLGGLYAASLYFSIHSFFEHHKAVTPGMSLLLFSYGSGSTATLMRAQVRRARPDGFAPHAPTLEGRLRLSHEQALAVNKRQLECKAGLDTELPPRPETETAPKGRYYLKRLPAGNELRQYEFVEG